MLQEYGESGGRGRVWGKKKGVLPSRLRRQGEGPGPGEQREKERGYIYALRIRLAADFTLLREILSSEEVEQGASERLSNPNSTCETSNSSLPAL